MIPGKCVDFYQWWLGSAVSSVIIDAIILILPLPSLWELHLKPARKVLVSMAFVCGYAVIGISIGRLTIVTREAEAIQLDVTYNIVPVGNWLVAEISVSIVSICLPSIFSLVKRGITDGPLSLITTKSDSSSRYLNSHNGISVAPSKNTAQFSGGHEEIDRESTDAILPSTGLDAFPLSSVVTIQSQPGKA